ncbi:N-acetylglucosamine-6-phosphate deacetylase [Candidatus Aerophobetes bacterium]|nr:N-acetylglucosamine-6-phosphate deacetylase [Candidatus Aerophobetes bacterium]
MIILRGKVITEEDVIEKGEVVIEKDKIIKVGKIKRLSLPSSKIFHIPKSIIVPGFIDIHMHGLGKYGPKGKENITGISYLEPHYGTTGFVPTLASATHQEYLKFLQDVKEVILNQPEKGAKVLGAHLEGPYINPKMKGGMDEEYLRLPRPEEYEELIKVGGRTLKIMTLSPELPGSIPLIKSLRQNGTVVSLGHSLATENDLRKAMEAGLSHICHLFNAFPPEKPRELGVREPKLSDICLVTEGLTAEVISDGIHVHPVMIRLAIKAMGLNNIVAMTDSMVGTGLSEGIYKMSDGRKFYTKKGDVARLVEDKRIIVGSILTMNYALKNLVKKCGLSLLEASKITSLNPAKVIGLDKEVGSIKVGKKANLAVLNADFECLLTFIEGKLVYQKK